MIKLFIVAIAALLQTSIYTLTVTGISGNAINFTTFQGKKILIVNIATGSPRAGQLAGLQQLQQQYGDSLVIIGFPSNSFGNESRSNSEIQEFCESQYGVSFLLAARGSVKGGDIQPLYYWMTHQADNGVFDNEIQGDFQKYLFNGSGEPVGIFAGYVSPLSPQLVTAITQN